MARPRKGNPTIGEFCEKHLVDRPNKTVSIDNLVNAGKRRGLSDKPASYQRAMTRLLNDDMPEGLPPNSYFTIIAPSKKWRFVVPEQPPQQVATTELPEEVTMTEEEEEGETFAGLAGPISPNEELLLRWFLEDLATIAIVDGRESFENLLDVVRQLHADKRNHPASAARRTKMSNEDRMLYLEKVVDELRDRYDKATAHSWDKMLQLRNHPK